MSENQDSGVFEREIATSGVEWRRDWHVDCTLLANDVYPHAMAEAAQIAEPGAKVRDGAASAPATLRRSLFRL